MVFAQVLARKPDLPLNRISRCLIAGAPTGVSVGSGENARCLVPPLGGNDLFLPRAGYEAGTVC